MKRSNLCHIWIMLVSSTFLAGLNDSMSGGMQLLPDPLFSIPTDNTYILSITSTDLGRIFMAGKDGCLYEIAYQAEAGWLSQRCRKINHSKSSLSFLIPSVLQFSFSEDGNLLVIFLLLHKNTSVYSEFDVILSDRSHCADCYWQHQKHTIYTLWKGCSAGTVSSYSALLVLYSWDM